MATTNGQLISPSDPLSGDGTTPGQLLVNESSTVTDAEDLFVSVSAGPTYNYQRGSSAGLPGTVIGVASRVRR